MLLQQLQYASVFHNTLHASCIYCFKSSDAHFLDITWTITWSTDDHLIILGGLLPGFPALHHKVGDIRILGLSLNLSSSMCISASKNAPNLMRYRLTPIAPPWPEFPLLNRDPVVVSLAKSSKPMLCLATAGESMQKRT